MPVTRCPHCAQRLLVASDVLGRLVACSRCQQTFEAREQSTASRVRELLLVVAAVAAGVVASWLLTHRG
jgi:predicted Zn finger-like uncharacterized protein